MTKQSKPCAIPLTTLFNRVGVAIRENTDPVIEGLALDSRAVQKNWLFAALAGTVVDGVAFIPNAIKAGASAILCAKDAQLPDIPESVVVIRHENPRQLFSQLAASFYNNQPQTVVAVTGTNGKTSMVHFCRQIWHLMGINGASIGTTGIADGAGKIEYDRTNFLTTPDAVKLHAILSDLQHQGISHLAMEASSHGLDQYRLDGVSLSVGAFINFSRDHLDYHGSFENYFNAKMRLFDELLPQGSKAIINADCLKFEEIQSRCIERNHQVISFGRAGKDIIIHSIKQESFGQTIDFDAFGERYTITTQMVGEFQVYNLMGALAIAVACGAQPQKVIAILDKVQAVAGRMQRVTHKENPVQAFVDYSHTPDALEKALQVLKPLTKGKLWVVFGCGGDRDKGKRPLMGKVACDIADEVVVTDDNPRNENPEAIRNEIIAACSDKAHTIGDRREAIMYALSHAGSGDMVLIAGKGHEQTQTIGASILPFDDVTVAEQCMMENL